MELRDAVIYGFPYKLRPKPKIAEKRPCQPYRTPFVTKSQAYKTACKLTSRLVSLHVDM